jgi:hypothetical protein
LVEKSSSKDGDFFCLLFTSHSSWNSGFSLANIKSINTRVYNTPNKIRAADPGCCAAVAGKIARFKLVKKI